MEYKDYYKMMGVAKNASQKEIKQAYRKLARKYHPDVSKESNAEQLFKELGEAYEVLKDPEKRSAYDQLGANWKAGQQGFQPPPNWGSNVDSQDGSYSGGASAEGFSDFFESLFGHAGGGFHHQQAGTNNYQTRGEDSHAKIFVDIEDAYLGTSRTLSLRSTIIGEDGRPELKPRTIEVKIPKGIKAGQSIRLKAQGNPGVGGGPAGDLYLEIAFNPHSIYKIDGADVSLKLPITTSEAALGGKIKVPTPAGTVDLTIPAAASSGKKMRLKGRGIPSKQPGDFYVILDIVMPDNLSQKEIDLYRELQTLSGGFNPREKIGLGGQYA